MSYADIGNELITNAKENMIKAAKQCLEDANREVPVDTGELKSSGHIEITNESIDVVYDADHAIYVHENPDYPGYKWLERTVDQNTDKYVDIIGGEE